MKHLYELLINTPQKSLRNIDYDDPDDYYIVKRILINMSNAYEDELDTILNKISNDGFKSLTEEELITLIELYLGKILSETKDEYGKKFLLAVGINRRNLLYTTNDIDYLKSSVRYLVHLYKIYF